MIKNYYYVYQTIENNDENQELITTSQINVSNEPLRYKSFETTQEILEKFSNYNVGEIVYNKEINAPCIRTEESWAALTTTVLN